MASDCPMNLMDAIVCVQEKRLNCLGSPQEWQFLKSIETQLLARFIFMFPNYLKRYGIAMQFYEQKI